jgi:hypothetical protein
VKFWERNFLIQCYGTFPGWLHCKGLELFLYSPVETLPTLQNVASRFVVVWNRRGMSSQLNLKKVRRETGEIEQSSEKILTLTPVLMWSDQSEKTWL